MRKPSINLSERTLMFAIGGQLFTQAPNKQPRKAEIIMTKVRDEFRKNAYNDNEYYSMVLEEDNLYGYVDKLLKDISEFEELNLSQIEYEKGITVDDESRPKYSFTSRCDKYDSESWKKDFIDLDAFIRNVVSNIYMVMYYDEDCFCCIYSGDDNQHEMCKTCNLNPKLTMNHEGSRAPKAKYTFACAHDCYFNKYICCEECNKKKICEHVCDSKSSECGQAMQHVNGKPVKTVKQICEETKRKSQIKIVGVDMSNSADSCPINSDEKKEN